MRPHIYFIAFCIVIFSHFMALYGLTHIPESQNTLITPPVIQATLITPPPEPLIEKPEPPKPVPPKKQPEPPKENKPRPKIPEPVVEPEKIISVDAPKTETTNTLAAPPPPPEPEVIEEEPVTPAKIDAKNKDNPPPNYPRLARRLGQEGSVVLEIYILADGSVGDVRVKKSSGFPRLDEAAMEAAKNWHYTPAMRGNEPIDFWYSHSVKFVLN